MMMTWMVSLKEIFPNEASNGEGASRGISPCSRAQQSNVDFGVRSSMFHAIL